ncbi:hypothetical protein BBP40_001931 [Aspergillus hancockii]|nr:hypothetical protein BBP40_001931 [Aspergillus hancockii]
MCPCIAWTRYVPISVFTVFIYKRYFLHNTITTASSYYLLETESHTYTNHADQLSSRRYEAKSEIKSSPSPTPTEIILIRNNAVAIYPVDAAIQDRGTGIFAWLTYPYILGTGVSGESALRVGGCVPLAIATTASGMFQKGFLALNLPDLGCKAIQMSVAAGYEVVTTASEKNFRLVRRLGATVVLDYHSEDIVEKLIGVLKGKKCVGALAITYGSVKPCVDVNSQVDGRKFVAAVLPVLELKETAVEAKMIWEQSWRRMKLDRLFSNTTCPKRWRTGHLSLSQGPRS